MKEYRYTDAGRFREPGAQRTAWEQACRSRWRALLLIVKAKLEAIAAGISTIEREFLPDLVLPNGGTIEQALLPQLERVLISGELPPLLPG